MHTLTIWTNGYGTKASTRQRWALPTARHLFGKRWTTRLNEGLFLFPFAREGQVRKNVRSQAPLSFRTRNIVRA